LTSKRPIPQDHAEREAIAVGRIAELADRGRKLDRLERMGAVVIGALGRLHEETLVVDREAYNRPLTELIHEAVDSLSRVRDRVYVDLSNWQPVDAPPLREEILRAAAYLVAAYDKLARAEEKTDGDPGDENRRQA
jgi:hypothetical protein